MSKVICIAGESGSGKTTSMRSLPPQETIYIDCDMKGLSWKGWRDQYNKEKRNYIKSSAIDDINKTLTAVDAKSEFKKVKYVVIDTLNSIMADDEMKRAKEKGYDKWVDLAQCVWELVSTAYNHRDDLTIIFVAHTQTERDESGYNFTRIKTNGKKLDKLCLESRLNCILLAKCVDGKYLFETHSNNSTAKTPLGCFEAATIENDIMAVINAMKEF